MIIRPPLRLFLLLLLVVQPAVGLKFLFYNPRSTRSHINFVNKLIDILVEGGHEVVSYNPEISKDFGANYDSKKATKVIEWIPPFEPKISVDNLDQNEWTISPVVTDFLAQLDKIFRHFGRACDHQLSDEKLMEQLRNEKFDLGLSEFFDPCGFGIFKKIGLNRTAAMLTISATPLFIGMMGVPACASFVPDMGLPKMPPFSFLDRLKVQLSILVGHLITDRTMLSHLQAAFNKHTLDMKVMNVLGDASIVLINNDELIDFPQPVSYKMIPIAGVGLRKNLENPQPLDKKLQEVFDQARTGVVYISFGSVANSFRMPPPTKRAFVETIRRFPDIQFLWKYEHPEDGTIEHLPNLHLSPWFPQVHLFAQPKLLAFVSHGGANSMTEAMFSGIPVVSIPLFTDQPRNALVLEFRGTGVIVQKMNITEQSLTEAIQKIVFDPKYKQKAIRMATLVKNKPFSADERVLKYAEFAARFEDLADVLDLPGRHMSTSEFYNIDVFFVLFAVILLVMYILFKIIRWIIGRVFGFVFSHRNAKSKKE